jgi:hypothetical protein
VPWALWVRAKTRWSRTGRMGTHIRSSRARPAAARSRPPRPWWPCIAGTPYYRVSSTGRTRTTPGFRAFFDKRQRVMERVGCSFTGGLFLLNSCRDSTWLENCHAYQSILGRPSVRPEAIRLMGIAFEMALVAVNPVRAGRRLVGRGWEAGLDEARPVSGQALTHTLDQHAANLGGRGQEANRNAGTPPPLPLTRETNSMIRTMVASAALAY